jgi:hypothetical protein
MSANFPFQENIDVFIGEKTDKEYWLKISSLDATNTSPFDFNVKFNMNIRKITKDLSGNVLPGGSYLKEAVIEDKYQEIKRLEVTDVIIPRYIPNNTLGLNFDGVNLVHNGIIDEYGNTTGYLLACYPGVNMKCGNDYIKLCSYKDTIIITDISNSILFNSDVSNNFRYKDSKIIDHLTIENIVYPIIDVSNNLITICDFNTEMPLESKLTMGNYYSNIINYTNTSNVILTASTLTINNFPAKMLDTTFAANIIRLYDNIGNNAYFTVSRYIDVSGNSKISGSYVSINDNPVVFVGNVTFQLFGFGIRDLIDERIMYLELDPFIPVKSSASNNNLNKMFGVLFPSTQSKEWLALSGEPRESFLPRDLRKLDKITIKLYDSDGVSLNDTFKNRPGLLNTNYFKNLYTTVLIKIEEVDKSLIAKKS